MNCLVAVLFVISVLSVMLPNIEAGVPKVKPAIGMVTNTVSTPWHVSVTLNGLLCVGVIVDEQYILVTAVCVNGYPKQKMRVIIDGKNGENSGRKNGQYRVQDIIIHSNFDKKNLHNNIALLKLESSIKLNEKTQKIPIAEEDDLQEGDKLTINGWCGSTIEELVKRKLKVSYMPYKVCRNKMQSSDVGFLCTLLKTDEEKGCRWEIGASLVNNKGQLVGLGTIGVPNALGSLNISPRLYFYNDWIRTTIKGCAFPKEDMEKERRNIVGNKRKEIQIVGTE